MSTPQTFSEADLLGAVGEQAVDQISEDANFAELVEAVGRWIQDRIENDPDSLPATFMLKMYLDGKKAMAAKEIPDDLPEVSILDRIDALPPEHALALVRGEIARLDSLKETFVVALARLMEET